MASERAVRGTQWRSSPSPPGVVLVLRAAGVASSHITEGCRKVSNARRSKVFGVAWKVPATSEPRWPERALGAS